MRVNSTRLFCVLIGALVVAPACAEAQQRTKARRQQTIEIRGQVPTPQVVTVRPREVPTLSRQMFAPNFYDRSFWGSILPGYQVVAMRDVREHAPLDSAPRPVAAGVAPAVLPENVVPQPSAQAAPPAAAAAGVPAAPAAGERAAGDTAARVGVQNAAPAAAPSGGAAAPTTPAVKSPADSARAAEIEAIKEELRARRKRLDSLEKEVEKMGKEKNPPKTASDSTQQ
jgi:hypothetical protein